jgi:hypothetical protein
VNGERTVELTAQWAVWGVDADDSTYRVLASSSGELTAWDFENLEGRYGIGTPDQLPQYTVFWVPDAEGGACYVGIAIREYASYSSHDVRARYDVSGREIVYSRLFCVRYLDLAKEGVSFAELLGAAEQLPPGGEAGSAPLRVRQVRPSVPLREPPDAATPGLAEVVAALLLTGRPVCVLGADEVPVAERLAFIDQTLSLLPYGLRATVSAATWASPTARDLKLRLFFTSARRDDGSGVHHVHWDQHGWGTETAPDSETVQEYLRWLHRVGPNAVQLLAEQTAPVKFSVSDLAAMVTKLPRNVQVANILRDLASSLREGDSSGAVTELNRLRPYTSGRMSVADREHYRSQVMHYGLLGQHQGLRPGESRDSLYRTVLKLAFESPLRYEDYCAIVDAAGGPQRGKLRSVLLDFGFTTYVPRLLASAAEPRFDNAELMTALEAEDMPPGGPLNEFERDLPAIRQEHRAPACDFAVRYLCTYGADPEAELTRRGYLAGLLAEAFPDDPYAQQVRLRYTLQFVHGQALSRGQIRELFTEPGIRPTPAFEAAVAQLAASPAAELLIAEQAAEARIRQEVRDRVPADGGRPVTGRLRLP